MNEAPRPSAEATPPSRLWGILIGVVSTVAWIVYPLLVYLALRHGNVRWAAIVLLVMLVPRVLTLRRSQLRSAGMIGAQVGVVGLLASSAVLFDDPRYLLQIPVLINVFLLATFGVTLWRPVSMIERYARLITEDLTPTMVAYCRKVTVVWCVFFVLNGSVAEFLALKGSYEAWALYSGLIAYGLIGTLFAVEYTVRRLLFWGVQDDWIDRLLGKTLFRSREKG